jgi:hypothetical protein
MLAIKRIMRQEAFWIAVVMEVTVEVTAKAAMRYICMSCKKLITSIIILSLTGSHQYNGKRVLATIFLPACA